MMAVEVGWRGPELGTPSFSLLKHKAPVSTGASASSWRGADPQKVLQLMMGQVHEESQPTLDLLGSASSSAAASAQVQQDEFVELDPDVPLPSGWEKCLNLKSGKVYFLNRQTGVETDTDPRKQVQTVQPAAAPQTLDFLGSKESETEKLGAVPTFSGRDLERDRDNGCQPSSLQWGAVPGWLGSASSRTEKLLMHETDGGDSGLELKLNLHSKGPQTSVCTLEKVEMALLRSEKMLGKRIAPPAPRSSPPQADHLLRSNQSAAHISPTPSTSSSSTTTTPRPAWVNYQLMDKENQNSNKRPAVASAPPVPSVVEMESDSTREMVMLGGCKSCLMFVMLSKSNPICPRCGASAALEFSSPLPKRFKVDAERLD